MKFNIRFIYLYLFSFVGLLTVVIGSVRLVDLGLKVYVFNNADVYTSYPRPVIPEGKDMPQESEEDIQRLQMEETNRQRKRDAAGALSMIIIGLPLYLYHWKTIQKENRK